jgi:hypothetical protein
VPHGNRDRAKEGLRTDSATAQFPVISLILSLAVLFQFSISSLDISGAYLQAGPLQRDVYIRPPPVWSRPNILWRLLVVKQAMLPQLCDAIMTGDATTLSFYPPRYSTLRDSGIFPIGFSPSILSAASE